MGDLVVILERECAVTMYSKANASQAKENLRHESRLAMPVWLGQNTRRRTQAGIVSGHAQFYGVGMRRLIRNPCEESKLVTTTTVVEVSL